MAVNEVDDGFNHIPNLSTTHIIYQEDNNNGTPGSLKLHPDFPYLHLPSNFTICSSSRGILLVYDAWTSNYCLFNPSIRNFTKPLPTPSGQHLPNSCTAILALTLSCFDVVFLTGPYDKSLNGHASTHNAYRVDIFSSYTDCWYSFETSMIRRNLILPTSHVSCGRNVFFLVYTNTTPKWSFSILRIDIENRATYNIDLPYCDTNIDPRIARLGRIGDKIGFVIVNHTNSLVVEVYSLNLSDSGDYNWQMYCLVNVDLEDDRDAEFSILDGQIRIKCRVMPRPMRFESFKLQLPLWVDGKFVMLESNNDDDVPLYFRFEMLKCGRISLGCFIQGLPHVASDIRLRYRIVVD